MKPFKLVLCGMSLAVLLGCGLFDEAADYQLARKGWCVEVCGK
jgi:hypothetical protein